MQVDTVGNCRGRLRNGSLETDLQVSRAGLAAFGLGLVWSIKTQTIAAGTWQYHLV